MHSRQPRDDASPALDEAMFAPPVLLFHSKGTMEELLCRARYVGRDPFCYLRISMTTRGKIVPTAPHFRENR